MTKEEAVKILQNICFEVPEIKEALQIAIGALSKPQSTSNMEEEKQSVEGLEEELKRYINSDEYINTRENGTILIARHFAEWGAEHLKR